MRPQRSLIILFICVILVSGCTGVEQMQNFGGDVRSSGSGEAVSYAAPASYATPAPMAKMVSPERAEESDSAKISPDEQKIIRTADITIEVSDVRSTVAGIGDLAENAKGLVQTSSVSVQNRDHYSGFVTIRIPERSFDQVITDIQKFGTVVKQNIKGEDVTEEYIDIAAQKSALQNQLLQYNRIMEKANNVTEILDVQQEIERVQVSLDRIEGKIRYLDNRISLSTISVTVKEPETVSTSGQSITSIISEGLSGFIGTVIWLFVLLLTLLPILILVAIILILYRWKKGKNKGKTDLPEDK